MISALLASMTPPHISEDDSRQLEQLDAWIQLATLGAYADGNLADEERLILLECIAVHAASEDDARMMIALASRLPEKMPPLSAELRMARIKQIKNAIPSAEDRLRAFELTVDVTNAQNGIGLRETRTLVDMVLSLDIDEDRARALINGATADRRNKIQDCGREILKGDSTLRSASDSLAPPMPQADFSSTPPAL